MAVEFSPVVQRILRHHVLQGDEQHRLLVQAQNGDQKALNRLVECNMRLVVRVAMGFRRAAALEDLIQEGTLGLMEAIRRFQPNRGLKLSTYAYFWIVMRCRKEARLAPGVVVASVRKLGARNRVALPQVPLDTPLSGDHENTIGSSLRDESPPADESLHRARRQHKVKARVHELFPDTPNGRRRKREILERLEDSGDGRADENLTLNAIGSRLGLSRERVRQLEKKMQEKMERDPVLRKLAAQ